jgi:diguanylate cyclase (GGDEF)-like protein
MSDNLDKREGFERSELEWDEVKGRGYTDLKTGALNSNAFLILGPIRLKEAVRDGSPLSLVFLDVDKMKRLNKKYGHQGMDEMMAGFVQEVTDKLRDVDFIFRWGGDEFLLLLRKTDLLSAERFVVPKIKLAASNNKILFSIGLSVNQEGDSIEDMIRRADKAMYMEKEAPQG